MSSADDVLAFWFGPLDALGRADAVHSARWWKKDPAFDDEIRRIFLADHQAVAAGHRQEWLATPRGRLAYVIVLDQLSRNLFRGTAAMFATDALALAATLGAIAAGEDRRFTVHERAFLYMPFQHSEELSVQDRGITHFQALEHEAPAELRSAAANYLDFARQHRAIIARFGRFPHRNAILERPSTAEELEFLKTPGSSF